MPAIHIFSSAVFCPLLNTTFDIYSAPTKATAATEAAFYTKIIELMAKATDGW